MSIVKSLNKKTGVTYVYESESYWDPEKKQPRNRRKLIGKLDENGEVVPTGKKGPKIPKEFEVTAADEKAIKEARDAADLYQQELLEARNEIYQLKEQIRKLEKEKRELLDGIQKVLEKHRE